MTRSFSTMTAIALATFAFVPAFAQDTGQPASSSALSAPVASADGAQMGNVSLEFSQSGMGIAKIELSGVPAGTHAVHFHETGLCEGPDFKSAGGHLAGDKQHGVGVADGPHPGDMPNIEVSESGMQTVTYFVPGLTSDLVEDQDGTAFIIHEGTDDYESQPAGDAGGRIACGVISAAK